MEQKVPGGQAAWENNCLPASLTSTSTHPRQTSRGWLTVQGDSSRARETWGRGGWRLGRSQWEGSHRECLVDCPKAVWAGERTRLEIGGSREDGVPVERKGVSLEQTGEKAATDDPRLQGGARACPAMRRRHQVMQPSSPPPP